MLNKTLCKLYKIPAEFIQINHFISKLKDFLVDLLPYVLKFTEFCQMENFFSFNTTFKTLVSVREHVQDDIGTGKL